MSGTDIHFDMGAFGTPYTGPPRSPIGMYAMAFSDQGLPDIAALRRAMNYVGKTLLAEGIDCRTPAEQIRHDLHIIKSVHKQLG